jgi:fatty acid-binding protein DegV
MLAQMKIHNNRLILVEQTPAKSKAASKVLQLMDKDFSYQEALKTVLSSDKRLNKRELEKELNIYI